MAKNLLITSRYPGVPHGFHGFAPTMTAAKKWQVDMRAGLKWILAQKL
jgi:hypothetical protein